MEKLISTRYAQALFQYAEKKGCIDSVARNISVFLHLYQHTPRLAAFLNNPTVRVVHKQQLLTRLAQGFHPAVKRFLVLVARMNRAGFLATIAAVWLAMHQQHQHVVQVQITAAHALSQEIVQQLIASAKRIFHLKKLTATIHVDPAILGGYILQVQGHCLDVSIGTRLQKLLYFWKGKKLQ